MNNLILDSTDKEKFSDTVLSEFTWITLIIVSTGVTLLFSWYCYLKGISTLLIFLLFIPLILLSCHFRYLGFLSGTLLSGAILTLLSFSGGDQIQVLEIWGCFFVFEGIAAIIAYQSEQVWKGYTSLNTRDQKFQILANYIIDWEYWFNRDLQLEYTTPSCYSITGYTPEEFYRNPDLIEEIILPDDVGLKSQHGTHQESETDIIVLEFRIRTKGGDIRWIIHTSTPLFDKNGTWIGQRISNHDITGQKRREEAQSTLNQQRQGLTICNKTLLQAEDEQMFLNDVCRILCVHSGYRFAWIGYLEYNEHTLIRPRSWYGKENGQMSTGSEWEDHIEIGKELAESAVSQDEEVIIQDIAHHLLMIPHAEEAIRYGYHAGIAIPLRDENAKILGVLTAYSGAVNGITPEDNQFIRELAEEVQFGITSLRIKNERKRAEEAVKSAVKLNLLINTMSMSQSMTYTVDEAERLTSSTIGFFHLVNPDEDTIKLITWSTGTRIHCYVPSETECKYPVSKAGVWVDCIKERRPIIHNDYKSLPHKMGLPEGHIPVIRELVVPIFDENAIIAIIGVGNKKTDYDEKDIDVLTLLAKESWTLIKRKQAEEALSVSEEKYRSLVENIPVGVYQNMPEKKGTFIWANIAMASIFGFDSLEEFLQHPIIDLYVFPEERTKYLEILHRNGSVKNYRIQMKKKEGTIIWISVTSHTRSGPDGSIQWIDGILEDITANYQLEELKWRTLGQIEKNMEQFAILNDQIRNPLAVILAYISMSNLPDQEIIEEQVSAINGLVDQLDQGYLESEKVHSFLQKHQSESV